MIKDLRELQALLKLCRKQGVLDITVGGVSIKFGELPPRKAPRKAGDVEEPAEPHMPDEPTLEQLAFLSAGGVIPGMMP